MNHLIKIAMIPLLFCNIATRSQEIEYEKLIQYSTMAPSGHNTQPWIFKVSESTIEIHPDFRMSLPIVDANNRELYISLGCALENLTIAANEFGYEADANIIEEDGKPTFIRVKLINSQIAKNYLFDQIKIRQTNRSIYNYDTVPDFTISKLDKLVASESIKIHYFKRNSSEFNDIRDLILEGNTIQMNDNEYKNELLHWIRFNKKHTNKHKNGISNSVMQTPSAPVIIGRPIVKSFLKPEKQNKSDIQKINSSSHLVLFTINHDNPLSWIMLGRLLERFLLETTRLGIANAYLNQPCEVYQVKEKLKSQLNINNEQPSILLRIGYAEPLPYSPRKNVYEVIEYK